MSYSFRIADGDLVALGNQLDLVFGVDKLKQDIDLWMRERYGGDRFHVTMGSVLQEFIGDIVSGATRAKIHAEVLRVLAELPGGPAAPPAREPRSCCPPASCW